MQKKMAGVGIRVVAAVFLALLAPAVKAQSPADYTQTVRPVLEHNCADCHLNGNRKGGFAMDTRVDMMKGGNDGVDIVPGDPANSLLVKLIRGEGPADHPVMPPKGHKLSDADIAVITSWVKAGAMMPADQAAPQRAPGGGGGGMAGGRAQAMDLASAKKMVAAVEAAAESHKEHVAICVMDVNGDVVLAERMDAAARMPITMSQGKARAVLMFGIPTGMIEDAQRDKKPVTAAITAPPIGGGGEMTLLSGGLPVMKDGKMIGAIGVGGSASDQDEKFAQIGIDAAGLTSK